MIPTLYEENETTFLSNGLGRLSDAISCIVTQNKAGTYELSMEYPLDGIHVDDISTNRIIYAQPERGKGAQPFRIRNIEKDLKGIMTITARHSCYDLNYYACKEFGQTDVVPYQVTPSLYSDHDVLIGVLTDLIMYNVQTGSTTWTLTLQYPSDGIYASDFSTSCYIYAQPEIGRDLVMFDITQIKTKSGVKTITASAAIVPYVPTDYNKMTVSQALGYISSYTDDIQTCPFTFVASPDTAGDSWSTALRTFWSDIPKAVKPLLQGSEGSVLDVFGGEWEYDHYTCILHESRGSDNGVQYRYGKDITNIRERVNIDEIYTHAFSFWKGTASSSTDTEEGEYYTKTGTIKEILNDEYSAMFPTQRTLIIDASDDYENEPTVAQLDSYTTKYVSSHSSGTPTVTIEVSIIDLTNTKEYEDIAALERVNLYDTVTVVFPRFGINVKSKVTEIEYDVLKEVNTHVIIGDVTTKLANIIAKNKSDIVKTKYDLKKWADKAMERATEALAGWNGGNIRKNYSANDHKQQSMYIMNTDNIDTASKALIFDGYGVGVSSNGARGNYTYMVNMAGDNVFFTDSFAEDGDTNASFLKRGEISSGEEGQRSYWNLEENQISLIMVALTVNGDVDVTGTFNCEDISSSGSISATGAISAGDDLSVGKDATISGTLSLGALTDDVETILNDFEDRITALENA